MFYSAFLPADVAMTPDIPVDFQSLAVVKMNFLKKYRKIFGCF